MKRAFIALSFSIATLAGCGDPVLDARIQALGGEKAGVKPSEYHRPGQPCTYCHSDYGGAGTFSLAGTIFAAPAKTATSDPVPVENATITVTDTTGVSKTKDTNCVGNFYFTESEYNPQFPLHVVVEARVPGVGNVRKVMGTRVDRASSCAECHFKNESEVSPGWVWVYEDPLNPNAKDPFKLPGSSCPGAANFR